MKLVNVPLNSKDNYRYTTYYETKHSTVLCLYMCIYLFTTSSYVNKSRATKFYMLAPGILRWFIKFWKICGPHSQSIFSFKLFCPTIHTFTLNFGVTELYQTYEVTLCHVTTLPMSDQLNTHEKPSSITNNS